MFRLMLWLSEIDNIYTIIKNKQLGFGIKTLKATSALLSFIYYCADNIVWLCNVGFLNKPIYLKVMQLKDQSSLSKTVLELIIYIYTYISKHLENKRLFTKLKEFDDEMITNDKKCYVYLRKLIINKAEMKYIYLEIVIYIMRLFMLIWS